MTTAARTRAAHARAAPTYIFAILCLVCVTAGAAPTLLAPAAAQHVRDSRVAQLRAALLEAPAPSVSPLLERLPDPPLELGIHTACKKFGRGCPDTYLAFLTQLLGSLQQEAVPHEGGDMQERESHANDTEVPRGAATTPADFAGCTSAGPVDTGIRGGVRPDSGDEMCTAQNHGGTLMALPSHELRLPLQLTWSFDARKRLENLLHRLAAREAELAKSIGGPVAVAELRQRHGIPPTARVHLVEDVDSGMAALLAAACALGRNASSPQLWPMEWSPAAWGEVYGAWCLHAEPPQEAGVNRTARPLLSLPPVPWRCLRLRCAAWYMRLLVSVDVLLSWLWTVTLCVAIPSAAVTSVLVWLCAGDAWADTAEAFVMAKAEAIDAAGGREAATRAAGSDAHADTTPASSPTRPAAPARKEKSKALAIPLSPSSGAYANAFSQECPLRPRDDELLRQQRLRQAVLRCRFVDSVHHRAPTLFFLKLRLLLCLLVALHLPLSLGRALWASHQVASSVPLLQYVLPTWLMACLSVYVVVPLQVVVLGAAIQGALTANAELLVFQGACAGEQRAIVLAAGPAAPTHRAKP